MQTKSNGIEAILEIVLRQGLQPIKVTTFNKFIDIIWHSICVNVVSNGKGRLVRGGAVMTSTHCILSNLSGKPLERFSATTTANKR